MRLFWKKRDLDAEVEKFNRAAAKLSVASAVDENIGLMKRLFSDVDIMRYKNIEDQAHQRYAIVFSDGMVDGGVINENILRPLMGARGVEKGADFMERLVTEVVEIGEAELTSDYQKIIGAICYGDTVLFADGCDTAALLNTKAFPLRAIAEPDSEKTLSGPREGFTEGLMQNISLIRRRARTNDLKLKQITIGRRTQTAVAVCYLDEIVNRPALDELMRRLARIDIDAILDANYLAELISDHRRSLFLTVGNTERPDTVVGKILEGRIAILVDGTPQVLTVPFLLVENFQASEDYYLDYYYASFSRLIRVLGFVLTVAVPGLYIAISAFHHEMFPTPLLLSITIERQSVPLPASVEAFVMLMVFEILRETGVRMPSSIGQALGIVGALVVGQAAVEAKLVAAPMIIVVGITGITNLLVPKIRAPVLYLRFFILILSSVFGFFGFAVGMSLTIIHMIGLSSFGVPLIAAEGSLRMHKNKDIGIRAPMWKMRTRPEELTENRTRMTGEVQK